MLAAGSERRPRLRPMPCLRGVARGGVRRALAWADRKSCFATATSPGQGRVQSADRPGVCRQGAVLNARGCRSIRRGPGPRCRDRQTRQCRMKNPCGWGWRANMARCDGPRGLPPSVQAGRPPASHPALQKKVDEWMAESPDAPPRAMVMIDSPTPHDSPLHVPRQRRPTPAIRSLGIS